MARAKVVLGSFVGALAIHGAMIACSSMGTPGSDGGTDAGTDVAAPTDVLGFDALVDSIRDSIAEAAQDVAAAETTRADAQGLDGGMGCTCTPPPAPEYWFSTQYNGAPLPLPDGARVTLALRRIPLARVPTGETTPLTDVTFHAFFWDPNPGNGILDLACTGTVRPDQSLVGGHGYCTWQTHAPNPTNVEMTVTTMTETEIEIRVRQYLTAESVSVMHNFTGLTFHATDPNGHYLNPLSAYRP